MNGVRGRLGTRLLLAVVALCFSAAAASAQMTSDAEFIRNIRKQAYGEILSYLVNGGNPNAREFDSTPALLVAVEIGDAGLVRTLLEYKANPDLFNRNSGETALMRAATQSDLSAAQLLVYFKADANLSDKQGETALIKAVRAKSADIVGLLVQAGADVELADYTGMTPLDHAERLGNQRIVKLLQTKPAAP
jgi:ankyrin repeat protein